MRCTACDRILNDFESTRKSKTTGEYIDFCNKCYSTVEDTVKTINKNTYEEDDVPDDEIVVESDNEPPYEWEDQDE